MNKKEIPLVQQDPWLAPYETQIRERMNRFDRAMDDIGESMGSLDAMSRGHNYFGLNRDLQDGRTGVTYREWAPGALGLSLIGDFNQWDRARHPMERDDLGVWSLFIADDGDTPLRHNSRVKVHVKTPDGAWDRLPAYVRRVVQDEHTLDSQGVFWSPPQPYFFQHACPPAPPHPRIYEAHVGMSMEKEGIATYAEFTEQVLPRVAAQGYNTLQLMACMHHPYYGSFGYQVSNFFAVSSLFGTPEDLMALIDAAHGLGIRVLMDLVHSHSVSNFNEGLNRFDGTDYQYFHEGERGNHVAWNSKLFDYGKFEVLRFLLSNVRYWLEDMGFDGFRFDGVTSMIYRDHGLGRVFGSYGDYFRPGALDDEAVVYLQLANALAHELRPDAITIAEEVSGLPGMARPIHEGGLGFDYRLAMGIPDYWIQQLKEVRDDHWHMGHMFGTLTNRRRHEKHVAYCESHDQALVTDKTIAFWLMDRHMYTDMARTAENPVIDRGMALHKMIRLVTFALGGEAWLNFMGNEFGHPEWIDFPREGNGFSFRYARRQWSLVDHPGLRYQDLNRFDLAMLRLDVKFGLLGRRPARLIGLHEEFKLLFFARGPLVFAFNFHPTRSFEGFRLGIPKATAYRVSLSTDEPEFGGFARILEGQVYPLQHLACHGHSHSVQLYLPSRTAQVLRPFPDKIPPRLQSCAEARIDESAGFSPELLCESVG